MNNFYEACISGNLIEVQKYYSYNQIKCGFLSACEYGNLEIIKWLELKGADVHMDDEYPLHLACMYGHLEVIKWLKSKNVNIHAKNEAAFALACFFEHLEVVQWFYQFDINLIHIERIPSDKILEEIFQLNKKEINLFKAIIKGNRKNIKEAIEEKTDYSILNHFAFKKSCYENKIEIVKYLSELNSRYYYETDDKNNIKYYEINDFSKNARNIF